MIGGMGVGLIQDEVSDYLPALIGAMVLAALPGLAIGTLLIVAGVKVMGGSQNWRVGLNVLLVLPLVFPNLATLLIGLSSGEPGIAPVVVLLLALVLISPVGLVALNLRSSAEWFIARANAHLMAGYPPTMAPPPAWPWSPPT